MLKSLTVWITTNCGKFLKRWEYQTTLPASWEICTRGQEATVRSRHGQTGSKLGKEYVKTVYVTLLISLICRVYHVKCQAGWSTSWNQDCQEKYQQPQICRWYHSNGRKWRVTRASWWRWKRRGKAGLKLNIQKSKIMASSPIISWQIEGEKVEAVTFYFLGLQIHWRQGLQPWKITLAPWKKSNEQPRQNIKKQRHHFADKGPYSQSYEFSGSHIWM